jgi:hypothetical protein
MTTAEELRRLLRQDEGPTLEFKDSRILSDSLQLAKILTAFANAKGGILLIGVKDDKSIEGMKAKKGHEEHIMNIASDRCDPGLAPKFERISMSRKGDVYVISVFQREGPYHAVKTRDGYRFFTRVGSTIREMLPSELSIGERGVEIEVSSGQAKFWSWLGKKILHRFYGRLDVSVTRFRMAIIVLGSMLIIGSILAMFRIHDGQIVVLSHPQWVYFVLAASLIMGVMLIDWFSYTPRTKCPKCNSYFSFHTLRKWVFDKRIVEEGLEEWKTRSLKRCDKCGYEMLGKLKYERVRA